MAQLLSNLPIGSKIKFGTYAVEASSREPIIWTIADKNHEGYPANSVTLITDKMIDQRAFDAKEPSNTDTNRKNYGNNRYIPSNLRQWLNKASNPWYVSQHTYDASPTDTDVSQPTGYADIPGFMSNFLTKELALIKDTTLTVAKNTVTDGGGVETCVDKFFLASNTEVGLANEPGGAEGVKLALFTDDASRISTFTDQAFINSLATSKPTSGAAYHYWLRSPVSSYSHIVRLVSTTGALYYTNAFSGLYGLRPLCNLDSAVLTTDAPDASGAYEILYSDITSEDLNIAIDKKTFSWSVSTIGDHQYINSQVEIYDSLNNLVKSGSIKVGVGNFSEELKINTVGSYTAKVKLWSDIITEGSKYSNAITYDIVTLRYKISLDRPLTADMGTPVTTIPFEAKQGLDGMSLKSIDSSKMVYGISSLNTDTSEISISAKKAKIDKIAYTIR